MDLYNISQSAPELLSNFSAAEAQAVSVPLALYILALAIYAIFIFKFYLFLAKKDVFKLDLDKYSQSAHAGIKKFFSTLLYLFKYLFLFPVVVFLWFAFLGLLLVFLSRSGNVEQVLLIAISLVGAIRVCAYFSEDLSRDLSKMLPFALLGVFIVDATYFELSESIAALYSLPQHWKLLTYYFLFIIALEFTLRIISGIIYRLRPGKKAPASLNSTRPNTAEPAFAASP